MERILFPQMYICAFDWLTSQKVAEEYEMIRDWFANILFEKCVLGLRRENPKTIPKTGE